MPGRGRTRAASVSAALVLLVGPLLAACGDDTDPQQRGGTTEVDGGADVSTFTTNVPNGTGGGGSGTQGNQVTPTTSAGADGGY